MDEPPQWDPQELLEQDLLEKGPAFRQQKKLREGGAYTGQDIGVGPSRSPSRRDSPQATEQQHQPHGFGYTQRYGDTRGQTQGFDGRTQRFGVQGKEIERTTQR